MLGNLLHQIFQIDFGIYLGLWTIITMVLFKKIQDPINLKKIENKKEREKQKALYIANYCSFIHAILIILICKFKNNPSFRMFDNLRSRLLQRTLQNWNFIHEDFSQLFHCRNNYRIHKKIQRYLDGHPPLLYDFHTLPLTRNVKKFLNFF